MYRYGIFSESAKIVHHTAAPGQIGIVFPVALGVSGSTASFIKGLAERAARAKPRKPWVDVARARAHFDAELADAVDGAGVDVVFACGELMKSLYEALPASRRGAYAETSDELAQKLVEAVGPGDAIMVKGSLGSSMAPLVEALKRHFGAVAASA